MAGGRNSGSDKRRAKRVPVALTAHARIGNKFMKEPLADISNGGLYLKTREPTREGSDVRIALALPGADGPVFCTLVGSVVRVDKDGKGHLQGLGVSFAGEKMSEADRALLEKFLAAHPPLK